MLSEIHFKDLTNAKKKPLPQSHLKRKEKKEKRRNI